MKKAIFLALTVVLVLSIAVPAFALPGKPNFSPSIYADGQAWGTKGNGPLPAPNGHNDQSFDKLYQIPGQLPVSEAGPGNPMYNGGRWWTVQMEWTSSVTPLLTSYSDIVDAIDAGLLEYASVQNPSYFQCPLLPVK